MAAVSGHGETWHKTNLKWLWLVGMFCDHKMHKIWSVDSRENY